MDGHICSMGPAIRFHLVINYYHYNYADATIIFFLMKSDEAVLKEKGRQSEETKEKELKNEGRRIV